MRIGEPGLFDHDVERVDVSVTFTWDLPEAERIARLWGERATTTIGGPACGTVGAEFVPGAFLRQGYVITSRGCPEKCWFCGAWKRDGAVARALQIRDEDGHPRHPLYVAGDTALTLFHEKTA